MAVLSIPHTSESASTTLDNKCHAKQQQKQLCTTPESRKFYSSTTLNNFA